MSNKVKIGVAVVVGILLLLFMPFVGVAWNSFFSKTTAETRGSTAQRERTVVDPNYRIASYDSFFNSCEAISAKERIIARYEEQLENATATDEKARLSAAITAESNVRDELIADYNADASKEDTRAHFLSSDLPFRIDPEGTTTCA